MILYKLVLIRDKRQWIHSLARSQTPTFLENHYNFAYKNVNLPFSLCKKEITVLDLVLEFV